MRKPTWLSALALLAPGLVVAASLESYRTVALTGQPFRVDKLEVKAGRAAFELTGAGRFIVAGNEAVGFAFTGQGSVELTVERGPFYPGIVTTLDEREGVKLDASDRYTDTFANAIFVMRSLPPGLGQTGAADAADLQEVFDRHLKRWQESYYPGLDHILADTRLNSFPVHALVVSLEGKRDEALYICNDVSDQAEMYGVWKRETSDGKPYTYMLPLVWQPFGFDIKVHPRYPYLQTAIDLELVSTDNVFLKEKTTTEITAGLSGLNVVAFNLLNGRSKTRERWDEETDPFTVTKVTDSSGAALEHSHRYHQLLVKLPRTLNRGEKTTLVIEAEGNLLKNYEGDSYLVLGNMAYFPQVSTTQTAASFHAVVKVKSPYVAAGCGRNLRRWQEGELACLETREEKPIAFPFIVVGQFQVQEKQEGPYDLKVYSYVMGKEKGSKNLLRNGLAILDYYSNGMEPFPYGELEVVEIPYFRHFFWQSPAGLVEITSEGMNPLAGDTSDVDTWLRRWASRGQNSRYAHEIAHQWFGNLAGFETDYDNWISESFAEYLSYMFMSDVSKEKAKAKEQFNGWQTDTQECSEKGSIYGAVALQGARSSQRCYTQLLYGKGPYVLHALRQEIGDESFKKLLFFLTKQAAKKQMKVMTEDVIQFVNVITSKDYRPWFDRYIYGTEVPTIAK